MATKAPEPVFPRECPPNRIWTLVATCSTRFFYDQNTLWERFDACASRQRRESFFRITMIPLSWICRDRQTLLENLSGHLKFSTVLFTWAFKSIHNIILAIVISRNIDDLNERLGRFIKIDETLCYDRNFDHFLFLRARAIENWEHICPAMWISLFPRGRFASINVEAIWNVGDHGEGWTRSYARWNTRKGNEVASDRLHVWRDTRDSLTWITWRANPFDPSWHE